MVKKGLTLDFLLFQVVFQPGVLFRLTGIPIHELTDTVLDAEAIFSKEIHQVNQRLNSTDNHLEMVHIVEDFLSYLVGRVKYDRKPVDKVGLYLLRQPRPVSLDWLASEACLSRKQFYRKFVERMGVSPKLYSRIIQFDNAVKLKNAQPTRDWLDIALELGYYDYQHLVRDFKEFTHLTPAQFYLQDSQAPERKFGYKET
jgi:AraC-like DNA-binding protein